jgi:hypothetical protein
MYFDGSYTLKGAGPGVVLIPSECDILKYPIQLEFLGTNNIIEYEGLLMGLCHTRFFKAKIRCSSYVCPGSSCHTYGQNVSTEYQCLYYIVSYYKKFITSPERTKQRNGPHLATGS